MKITLGGLWFVSVLLEACGSSQYFAQFPLDSLNALKLSAYHPAHKQSVPFYKRCLFSAFHPASTVSTIFQEKMAIFLRSSPERVYIGNILSEMFGSHLMK